MSLLLLFGSGGTPAGAALSGSTGVATSTFGRLSLSHALSGLVDLSASIAASLVTTHPLSGATQATTAAAGTKLVMSHPLAGSSSISAVTAGRLRVIEGAVLSGSTGGVTSTAGRRLMMETDQTVWEVRVVQRHPPFTTIAVLANAVVDSIDEVPNEPWTARFHMHVLDPQSAALAPEYLSGVREVQIRRDGELVFWGFPISARADDTQVVFDCVDHLWSLGRLFYGPVQNNFLSPNEDFEAGLTHWTAVGTTASVSSQWRALGAQSLKLVQANAGTDTYVRRRYTVTTTDQPVFFAVKATCHIAGAGWTGPAYEERGLYLEQQSIPGGAAVGPPAWAPINEHTQRDHSKPVRLETGITIPAGVTRTIEVRLYSPGGTIWWDATALVTEESVGSRVTGDAANVIWARVLAYAQDAAQGKCNRYLGLREAAGTFPHLVRIYQFYDNGNILESLGEYARIGALEFSMGWSADGTQRWIALWPGRRGGEKPAAAIQVGVNVVSNLSWAVNGAAITTSARVLGQGEGADREVGVSMDTSSLDGLVLESVESAPLEAPIDSLVSLAQRDLADSKAPVRTPEFTVPARQWWGRAQLGDRVPISADYGYIQEPGALRRIVRRRINAADDTITVVVN